jgi:hypothetical protein
MVTAMIPALTKELAPIADDVCLGAMEILRVGVDTTAR